MDCNYGATRAHEQEFPYLTIGFLFLVFAGSDLYVLGDDAWITSMCLGPHLN